MRSVPNRGNRPACNNELFPAPDGGIETDEALPLAQRQFQFREVVFPAGERGGMSVRFQ